MTEERLREIARLNDELYERYNACARAGDIWTSTSERVERLMCHLDRHFPGYHVQELLDFVRDVLANQVVSQ